MKRQQQQKRLIHVNVRSNNISFFSLYFLILKVIALLVVVELFDSDICFGDLFLTLILEELDDFGIFDSNLLEL
ncbi:hypothetical protein BLOT_007961 [Blomia tropicalis]|nr:hypothetical protein BLOT_007961 [Blomia tropicalis]